MLLDEKKNEFITHIHDNKVWAIGFDFNASDVFISQNMYLDIDFIKNSDFSIEKNKVTYQICPAKIIFCGVSSFKINLLSGTETLNHYKADCLYILKIEKKIASNSRWFFNVIFVNNIGSIELYADGIDFCMDEKNSIFLDEISYIPLSIRGKMK